MITFVFNFVDHENEMLNCLRTSVKKTIILIKRYNNDEIDSFKLIEEKMKYINLIYTYFDNYVTRISHRNNGRTNEAYCDLILFLKKYLMSKGNIDIAYMDLKTKSGTSRSMYMRLRKMVIDRYINDPVTMANHKKLIQDASNKFDISINYKPPQKKNELQKKESTKTSQIENWKAPQVPKMSRAVPTKIPFKRTIKKG